MPVNSEVVPCWILKVGAYKSVPFSEPEKFTKSVPDPDKVLSKTNKEPFELLVTTTDP